MNDELQFRPMSKGLGFHQIKDTSPGLPKNNLPPKKPTLIQQTTLFNSKHKMMNPNLAMATSATSAPALLKRASTMNKPIQQLSEEILPKITSDRASLGLRFFSWTIDIVALTTLMAFSSMLIFQLNNFSWDEPLQFFQMDFFWNLYLPLGIGFYLFYFMLFERVTGQTLGKLILGLKVVKIESDTPPTLWQCFLRNVFNLFSIATLGLLTVYDVVNWSLGLKIVKTNRS